MTRALILGVNGQDGSYLAEFLIGKGVEVVGWIPTNIPASTENISHILDKITLIEGSLKDLESLRFSISVYKPDEVYNLASPSSPHASWNSSLEVSDLSGLGVARLLEAIRSFSLKIRFYQASSSEMFGFPKQVPQNEDTPFHPRNPYGIAKLYGHWMTVRYRKNYDIYAVSGILFNHESPRRGLDFDTRKITHTAVKIKLGLEKELRLGNLEARRDWGCANDYIEAIWLMMHQNSPDDYVIGTGDTHSVREFCELAFRHLNLNYREYVKSDGHFFRPLEPNQLVADSSKAAKNLNWKANTNFEKLVTMMVEADLRVASS